MLIAFLIIYVLIVILFTYTQVKNAINDSVKRSAKRGLFKGLANIIVNNMEYYKDMSTDEPVEKVNEIQMFYNYYLSKNIKYLGDLKDIITVLSEMSMLIKISSDKYLERNNLFELKDYDDVIYSIIKHFNYLYPYKEYTSNQQKILRDLSIAVKDIPIKEKTYVIEGIQQEFNSLNLNIKENIKNNRVSFIYSIMSIAVSVIGVVVSIILYFIQ